MVEVLKTPDEWLRLPPFTSITIIDPDGWDRSNFGAHFAASWAEPITEMEMHNRVNVSTIQMLRR